MAGPLGGGVGESGSAHHQRLETSTVGPLEGADRESRSTHHQCQETLMVGPFGGGDGDPGMPIINARNVDGGPLGRRCQRPERAHHQHKKCQQQAPRPLGRGLVSI
jgi:hypothetical protein